MYPAYSFSGDTSKFYKGMRLDLGDVIVKVTNIEGATLTVRKLFWANLFTRTRALAQAALKKVRVVLKGASHG